MRPYQIAMLLLLTACSAKLVQRDYSPEKGGVVEFNNGGLSTFVQQRRANAYEKAREFCGGDFEAVRESDRYVETGASVQSNGYGGATVSSTGHNVTYITFKCK